MPMGVHRCTRGFRVSVFAMHGLHSLPLERPEGCIRFAVHVFAIGTSCVCHAGRAEGPCGVVPAHDQGPPRHRSLLKSPTVDLVITEPRSWNQRNNLLIFFKRCVKSLKTAPRQQVQGQSPDTGLIRGNCCLVLTSKSACSSVGRA